MSDINEILEKWQRLGQGMSMMNREAHYQALTAVKPTIVSFIGQLVSGMNTDDLRSFNVMGHTVTLRKLQPDSYSGTIKASNGDIVHIFEKHSIPEIAGQIQSLFELYHDDAPVDEASYDRVVGKLRDHVANDAEPGLVSQLLNILVPQPEPELAREQELREITDKAREIAVLAREQRKDGGSPDDVQKLKDEVRAMLQRVEALVATQTPVRASDDLLHQTISELKEKHDGLVDRAQNELNILSDRVSTLQTELAKLRDSLDERATRVTHIHVH